MQIERRDARVKRETRLVEARQDWQLVCFLSLLAPLYSEPGPLFVSRKFLSTHSCVVQGPQANAQDLLDGSLEP